jgi:hypothetical protein
MSTTLRPSHIAAIAMSALLALSAPAPIAAAAAQGADATPAPTFTSAMTAEDAIAAATVSDGVLRFDMAENGLLFKFDPDFLHDGMPANGSGFVTRGYLYPAGTLTESNGVLADGSPEFPDQVLGEWVCRGWFIGEGAHATTGAWNATTQFYNFGGEVGTALLVSDGYELADVGVTYTRPVTGGTGPFVGADGEVSQTLLGFNASMGVNVQFEIHVGS